MPWKRKSTESASATERSKRSRPHESPNASEILPNRRYNKRSITAFFDVQYKELLQDTEKAFALISQCAWRFLPRPGTETRKGEDEEGEDDDEDQNSNESDPKSKKSCQNPCVCNKPAVEKTTHPWVLSYAGFRRAVIVGFLANVRDTETFGVYTFNYHEVYGVLEVFENLVLDFDEEEGNWKNQWAICEAIAMLFMSGAAEPIFDECLVGFCRLIQIMFLTMLATLERQKLLGPDSEVKNLGAVMGMYVLIAAEIGSEDAKLRRVYEKRGLLMYMDQQFDDGSTMSQSSDDGAMEAKLSKTRHTSNVIMGYAAKYGFTGQSPRDLVKELARRKIKSPRLTIPKPTSKRNDPWEWRETLEDYKLNCRRPTYTFKGGPVGGDRLDITSWKPEERADRSFAQKEGVLSQDVLDAFKREEVPHIP